MSIGQIQYTRTELEQDYVGRLCKMRHGKLFIPHAGLTCIVKLWDLQPWRRDIPTMDTRNIANSQGLAGKNSLDK